MAAICDSFGTFGECVQIKSEFNFNLNSSLPWLSQKTPFVFMKRNFFFWRKTLILLTNSYHNYYSILLYYFSLTVTQSSLDKNKKGSLTLVLQRYCLQRAEIISVERFKQIIACISVWICENIPPEISVFGEIKVFFFFAFPIEFQVNK